MGPRYLSSDNDPLFLFRQWNANLRILEVTEVKTVPYVPLTHPFVERLIGTVRLFVVKVFRTATVRFQERLSAHQVHGQAALLW